MAHDLSMDVIAEGAETNADANDLYQLGCEYAQGYLFGEPMTPDRAIALVGSTQSEARAEARG